MAVRHRLLTDAQRRTSSLAARARRSLRLADQLHFAQFARRQIATRVGMPAELEEHVAARVEHVAERRCAPPRVRLRTRSRRLRPARWSTSSLTSRPAIDARERLFGRELRHVAVDRVCCEVDRRTCSAGRPNARVPPPPTSSLSGAAARDAAVRWCDSRRGRRPSRRPPTDISRRSTARGTCRDCSASRRRTILANSPGTVLRGAAAFHRRVDRIEKMHALVGHAVARSATTNQSVRSGQMPPSKPESVRRKVPRVGGRDRAQSDRR